jgi:hypothetical protein
LDTPPSNALEQLESGHAGHRHVEDETIESASDSGLKCGSAAFTLFDLKAQPPKILGQQKPHVCVIINNKKSLVGVLSGSLWFQVETRG